jgi:acylphosphatase
MSTAVKEACGIAARAEKTGWSNADLQIAVLMQGRGQSVKEISEAIRKPEEQIMEVLAIAAKDEETQEAEERKDRTRPEPEELKPDIGEGKAKHDISEIDESWVIAQIEEMKTEGKTWKEIARRINAMGIKTATGKPWSSANLLRWYTQQMTPDQKPKQRSKDPLEAYKDVLEYVLEILQEEDEEQDHALLRSEFGYVSFLVQLTREARRLKRLSHNETIKTALYGITAMCLRELALRCAQDMGRDL